MADLQIVLTFGNAQIRGARQAQEDYFAVFQAGAARCAIVADGMGGHVAGAIASELAVKSFRDALLSLADVLVMDPPGVFLQAIERANDVIARWAHEHTTHHGMGTTLVAACFHDRQVFHVSVGDSLLYRLRAGELTRLNIIHAFAETLQLAVQEGEISAEAAATHPDRSAITSALDGELLSEVDVPAEGLKIQPGDSYLLASDGIHSLSDGEIRDILMAAPNAQRAAENLVAAVGNVNAAHQDNTTVVVAHVLEEHITRPQRRAIERQLSRE